ncbi:to extracellular alkaline protease [Geosmithia morbida]|uniref:To extracellular alkaline protease n=1 Tax=Geosmithia morbida TaxID=1094350 RepID=A0A9P4Z018_9HYPO|nr:to extracellular alkaline protease [Geosmithia morbida]KAF4124931.1 to extracellular alkaline protease [Geosmithia morbida]
MVYLKSIVSSTLLFAAAANALPRGSTATGSNANRERALDLGGILGGVTGTVGDVVGGVTKTVGDVTSSVGDVTSSVGDVTSSVGDVGGVTKTVGDVASSVGGVKEAIGDMAEQVSGAVSKIAGMISNANASNIIPNRYIVVYNNTFDDASIDTKEAAFGSLLRKRYSQLSRTKRATTAQPAIHSIKMSTWRAARLDDADDDTIADMFNSAEVEYIEHDTTVKTTALMAQTNAPVGLRRLSSNTTGADAYVFDSSAGEGITAYVIDTGVLASHSEFEGRATLAANFVNNVDTDENGHGSHVAGTIAGATFGVAKKATIKAVKVLDGQGSGSNSGVLDGMQFVIQDVEENKLKGKAVVNMSLSGGQSAALNRAIQSMVDAGIVPVVAAGNEATDASTESPASAPNAITVGAMDALTDQVADFSNFGEGVDIFAQGVDVESVGIASDTATEVLSGTSMASPHVAGLAAYLMALTNTTDPATLTTMIKTLAKNSDPVTGGQADTTTLNANNGNTYQA